jgi:hypothetical protein
MTLDNKIKDLTGKIKEGRLTRRDFFKLGALVGAGALVNYACGDKNVSSPTDPTPPNTNNPVNIKLVYRNHTQGKYGERTITKIPGEQFRVKARDIGGGNVDENKVAVREFNFGNLIGFTNNRDLVLNAPNTDKTYEVYGFNIASGADYELMDEQNARLYNGKHNFVVWRRDFDGQTGPEYIWEDVFNQLNNALIRQGGGRYGFIDRKPNANSGDFSYGYGIPSWGNAGQHMYDWIIVHPEGDDLGRISTGLAEAFEIIGNNIDDIGGQDSQETITNYGSDRLNPTGRDLFAYLFVKE